MLNNKNILMIGNYLSKFVSTKSIVEELFDRFTEKKWRVITASNKKNRLIRLLDMIFTTWLTRSQYPCAHVTVYSGPAFFWAEIVSLVLKILHKPFLLTLHGGNLPAFSNRWPKRVSCLLKNATLVGTPSLYIKEKLKSFRPDIIYLPNGIYLNNYHYRLRSQATAKLVWLRAFHKIYNPIMAVRTLAYLKDDFPNIRLHMIGPDKKDGSLEAVKQAVNHLGVHNNLHITLGVPKSQVPSNLSEHDIFLNTTNFESFGVSVMEAAATGLCIVTTNVGELPYLWRDGEDALLVPPNDPKAMAQAVRRLLTEPDLAARLSHNARQKVEQFDWSVILPQWEALFQEVLAAGQSGAQ